MTQLSTAVARVDFGQAFTAFTSLATHPTHDALRRSVEGHGVATLAASDEHKRLLDKYKAAITTQIALFRQIHLELSAFLAVDMPVGELPDDLKNEFTVLLDVVRVWLALLQSPTRKLVATRLQLFVPDLARELESAMLVLEESCLETRDLLGFMLEDPTVDSSAFEEVVRVGALKSLDIAHGGYGAGG